MSKNTIIAIISGLVLIFITSTAYEDSFQNSEIKTFENKQRSTINTSIKQEFTSKTLDEILDTKPSDGRVKERTVSNCHPSYSGCLNRYASDYDCTGGSGNGPYYTGTVHVYGPDVFGLDRDGDGVGCE